MIRRGRPQRPLWGEFKSLGLRHRPKRPNQEQMDDEPSKIPIRV